MLFVLHFNLLDFRLVRLGSESDMSHAHACTFSLDKCRAARLRASPTPSMLTAATADVVSHICTIRDYALLIAAVSPESTANLRCGFTTGDRAITDTPVEVTLTAVI